MFFTASVAASTETYREFVLRANPEPPASLAGYALPPPPQQLIEANERFLEAVTATRPPHVISPTADARVAVPLLVQAVRDWSADGAQQRAACYAPVVAALRQRRLGSVPHPRLLVPGSGLGRLAFDLAAAFPGSNVVAMEPDVHSQIVASTLMQPSEEDCAADSCDAADAADATTSAERRAPPGQLELYPALHLSTNWALASDRLRAVSVPDVPQPALALAQRDANVSLVVGSFPDAIGQAVAALAGASGGEQPDGGEKGGGGDGGFDAVATVFFVDVLSDLVGALEKMHALLAPRRGLWVNLGPLVFPLPHGELGGASAHPLPYDGLRALVLASGFALLEERQAPCEYNHLPGQLERTLNTCFFFVAQPVEGAHGS